jgi:hypothetical protein
MPRDACPFPLRLLFSSSFDDSLSVLMVGMPTPDQPFEVHVVATRPADHAHVVAPTVDDITQINEVDVLHIEDQVLTTTATLLGLAPPQIVMVRSDLINQLDQHS